MAKKKKLTPEQLEAARVEQARSIYQARPFLTKVYMAMNYKFDMEFLSKHWTTITA